jgi:hypothetical protein
MHCGSDVPGIAPQNGNLLEPLSPPEGSQLLWPGTRPPEPSLRQAAGWIPRTKDEESPDDRVGVRERAGARDARLRHRRRGARRVRGPVRRRPGAALAALDPLLLLQDQLPALADLLHARARRVGRGGLRCGVRARPRPRLRGRADRLQRPDQGPAPPARGAAVRLGRQSRLQARGDLDGGARPGAAGRRHRGGPARELGSRGAAPRGVHDRRGGQPLRLRRRQRRAGRGDRGARPRSRSGSTRPRPRSRRASSPRAGWTWTGSTSAAASSAASTAPPPSRTTSRRSAARSRGSSTPSAPGSSSSPVAR